MKKRMLIICVFLLLILATATCTVISAVDSYQYDMNPANGVDLLEGLGAAMILVVGGFFIFYELDLFYTVYYFAVKPRTRVRSVLNVLANGSLVLIFLYTLLSYTVAFMWLRKFEIAPLILFLLYLLLRGAYSAVSAYASRAKA